jgi:hypothetical protein
MCGQVSYTAHIAERCRIEYEVGVESDPDRNYGFVRPVGRRLSLLPSIDNPDIVQKTRQ